MTKLTLPDSVVKIGSSKLNLTTNRDFPVWPIGFAYKHVPSGVTFRFVGRNDWRNRTWGVSTNRGLLMTDGFAYPLNDENQYRLVEAKDKTTAVNKLVAYLERATS